MADRGTESESIPMGVRLRFPLPKIFLAFSPELYYTKWTPAGVMEW